MFSKKRCRLLLAWWFAMSGSLGLARGRYYAAIAVNAVTYEKGMINDASTQEEADAFAMRNCGDKVKCKIVAQGLNRDLYAFISGLEQNFVIAPPAGGDTVPYERVELDRASKERPGKNYCTGEPIAIEPEFDDSDYVAIAWNAETWVFGQSKGQLDRFDAEDEALADCKKNSRQLGLCRIVLSALGQCIGVQIAKSAAFDVFYPGISLEHYQHFFMKISSSSADVLLGFELARKKDSKELLVCPLQNAIQYPSGDECE